MTSKDYLRSEARIRRAELCAAQPGFAGIIGKFAVELPLEAGVAVASYWPLRDEADPRDLASALAVRGHPILLPGIEARDKPLVFRYWREGDATRRSTDGIVEPLAAAEAHEPKILLVPLLAFDGQGHRLGYGGGYYDRSLAALRARGHVLAIGVAYAGQERAKLPHARHDQRLDMVVTEQGLRRFQRLE